MKASIVGITLACLLGLASASPIAEDINNVATTTRDWNMPLTTEPLVDFGKSGFLFKKREEDVAPTPTPQSRERHVARKASSYSNSGRGTFFSPNQGSCGWKNTKNDLIVAISSKGQSTSKKSPNCGRMVEIVNSAGKKVHAKVVDSVRL